MRIKPNGNRLFIKREEKETKTKGGIVIPETARAKNVAGKIIALGDEVADRTKYKIGKKVLFTIFDGVDINTKKIIDEYVLVVPENIVAFIDDVENEDVIEVMK